MGLEEVEADIRKGVESQVTSIRKTAENEAGEIINEGKKRVGNLQMEREREIEKIIGELKNREIASAKLQARKLNIEAKKTAIDSVFMRVKEKLSALGTVEKKEILSALLEKAKNELPERKYVFCNSSDRGIVKGLASGAGLELGETIDCLGGITLENKNREVRVDYTFDVLLEKFRKDNLKNVAEELFKA